jgi:hypothetical protein
MSVLTARKHLESVCQTEEQVAAWLSTLPLKVQQTVPAGGIVLRIFEALQSLERRGRVDLIEEATTWQPPASAEPIRDILARIEAKVDRLLERGV